jgi:hypothetical protein
LDNVVDEQEARGLRGFPNTRVTDFKSFLNNEEASFREFLDNEEASFGEFLNNREASFREFLNDREASFGEFLNDGEASFEDSDSVAVERKRTDFERLLNDVGWKGWDGGNQPWRCGLDLWWQWCNNAEIEQDAAIDFEQGDVDMEEGGRAGVDGEGVNNDKVDGAEAEREEVDIEDVD